MDLDVAKKLAAELMVEFGLGDWRFGWTQAESEFGHCDHLAKTIRMSRILTVMNDREEVENTIRHEIAHALAGPKEVLHGETFYAMARFVGARPERCYDDRVVTPTPKWLGTCPHCGRTVTRRRLFKDSKKRMACRTCCGRHGGWSPEFVFVWTVNR